MKFHHARQAVRRSTLHHPPYSNQRHSVYLLRTSFARRSVELSDNGARNLPVTSALPLRPSTYLSVRLVKSKENEFAKFRLIFCKKQIIFLSTIRWQFNSCVYKSKRLRICFQYFNPNKSRSVSL